MTSTIFLWAAAAIALSTAAIHAILGGMKYIRPVLAMDVPPQQKWLSYLSWHTVSIAILSIAAGFAAGALDPARADYALLSTLFAGSILVLAIYVKLRSGLPVAGFPVIPMFALVTLLGTLGVTL